MAALLLSPCSPLLFLPSVAPPWCVHAAARPSLVLRLVFGPRYSLCSTTGRRSVGLAAHRSVGGDKSLVVMWRRLQCGAHRVFDVMP
ncbi:hypothetical protein Zm00014a_044581 [Zea mays]|uniref:Secreted protein n=1 Tax=Zea mays TaxID=4577 RepID=A0A317YA29_MAIZE|nr:hypothetical protein Zm00014a_044581 [Zea mays]